MATRFPDIDAIVGAHESSEQISGRFINKLQRFFIHGASVSVCQFNQSLYHDTLFKQLNILCPDELSHAVSARRAEFLAGRYVARVAIYTCGGFFASRVQVGIGENRCPLWPDGIVGTITHCADIAACAVLPVIQNTRSYIGMDIEKVLATSVVREISSSICSVWEWQRLASLPFSTDVITTIIFSAKESLFKALYPYIGEYFGFECAQVKSVDPYKQRIWLNLSPSLVAKSGFRELECYYTLQSDFVITFVSQWLLSSTQKNGSICTN